MKGNVEHGTDHILRYLQQEKKCFQVGVTIADHCTEIAVLLLQYYRDSIATDSRNSEYPGKQCQTGIDRYRYRVTLELIDLNC